MPHGFRCPSCRKRLRLSEQDIGQAALCPACGLSFVVPEMEEDVEGLGLSVPGTEETAPSSFPIPHSPTSPAAAEPHPWSSPMIAELITRPMGESKDATQQHSTPLPPQAVVALAVQPVHSRAWLVPVLAATCVVLMLILGAVLIYLTGRVHRPVAVTPWNQPAAPGTQAPSGSLPSITITVSPDQQQAASEAEESLSKMVEAIHQIYDTLDDTSPKRRPSRETQEPIEVGPPALTPIPYVTQSTRPAPPPVRPPVQPLAADDKWVTDQQIETAIARSVEYLLKRFDQVRGEFRPTTERNPDYYAGLNALCVYALLQAGEATHDPRIDIRGRLMRNMIDRVKKHPMTGRNATYGRGIRATMLAMHDLPEDRGALRVDVEWLIRSARDGAYWYGDVPRQGSGSWDNSNSQYGLLGVWSGAEVGIEVPNAYWRAVQKHWAQCQSYSGGWTYMHGGGHESLSMTVAGIASLFVAHDYLEAPQFGQNVGRPAFSDSLARGLAWLERGNTCIRITDRWAGYCLYGIERVGLASGFKYFGRHDWYRELSHGLVLMQDAQGSYGDEMETAYALLFLSRGRHPILMNKLRFAGDWANRPRDLANLSRFAWRELERPLNWQVVTLQHDWSDWMDCPILYVASHEPPRLTNADCLKLRSFAEAGGMLFTQADGGSSSFNSYVVELSKRLFPSYSWQEMPADHPVFNANFQIKNPPTLRYLSNGSRMLWVHSPQDLTQHWQVRADKSQRPIFELGLNLFICAAGKADLRNRLSSPYLPPPEQPPSAILRVARVQYAGNWDPEPYAMVRFNRWFQYQTGFALDVAPAVALMQLDPTLFPVAQLTGTGAATFTDAEIAAVRKYVEAGGVLLIDACGGNVEFHAAVTGQLLNKAFPDSHPTDLSPEHPLLSGKSEGMDNISKPNLRPYAFHKFGKNAPGVQILSLGKGHVLYSALDLSTGLLGTNSWPILGHQPAFAQSFVKNVLLWTTDPRRGG